MSSKAKSSFAKHRARIERQGFVRVEVNVRKEDASLVRRVASALSDPSRQADARRFLRQRFVKPRKVSLKALLASAPFDGIDGIERARPRDAGKAVALERWLHERPHSMGACSASTTLFPINGLA